MPRKLPPPPELPWSLHKAEGWRGQYSGMHRWLRRLQTAKLEEERIDFLYAFFVSSNALADWLMAEEPQLKAKLGQLLASNSHLRLGRDLANMHKHRSLTDPKRGREPVLAREYAGRTAPARIVALSRGDQIELRGLALKCAAEWDGFLEGVSLLASE